MVTFLVPDAAGPLMPYYDPEAALRSPASGAFRQGSAMTSVTDRATRRLIEDRQRRGLPDTFAPRLSRRDGRIVLDFASKPADDDRVATTGGLRLFVAPDVADSLNDAVVDVQQRDGRDRLVVLRNRSQAS
jgi:Fe-S cluster assembly iron-binding protein IscA